MQVAHPARMGALRTFFATLSLVLVLVLATGAVAVEWVLRDVPRPAPPQGEPTLAHRGLACISTPSQRGWLRRTLVRKPTAETVARRQARSMKLRPLSRVSVEWALGHWLSRHYDDDELARLEGDSVWLGRGAYGLDEGARAWFGRRLDQLSLEQSALLVGLEAAPLRLDPFRDPVRAQRNRQVVIRSWERCGLVPAGSAERLEATPVLEGVLPAWRLPPIPQRED